MYYTYQKTGDRNGTHFERFDRISLAGCNNGIIAKFLKKSLSSSNTEPLGWTIEIGEILPLLSLKGNIVIIDMKPSSLTKILLFELVRVHGYSHNGWTPILMELRQVLIDEDPQKYKKERFILESPQSFQKVRAFLYLRGTIISGKLVGSWIFPPKSYTNGALLWPEAWKYFNQVSRRNFFDNTIIF